jgi:hypothetical protein
MITRLVDFLGGFALELFPSIDRTPFTIPDTQSALIHPFSFLLIRLLQALALLFIPDVYFMRGRETVTRVIVYRIRGIFPILVSIAEVREIGGPRISVEENNVQWIYRTDGTVDSEVEFHYAGVCGICRFIEGIIS